ncbi:ACT domain-containing protein [Pontibacillus sp. HMF3514]|uniref:ACT domain-containing protein n=1 Tax=Pontibacillus sp. HMF3514 TaxID=2692425 RepID=UPI00131FDE0E|nr:ACT domain-containing protein [Pontibacillus sp. HMF3514]QHE52705.1 ACT domain-containing protein [Pontibacillus sp. HMF3514]
MQNRRAIVSVIGQDQVGIIAKVTNVLASEEINVLDISQTILEEFFTMMMIIDVSDNEQLDDIRHKLQTVGDEMGLKINLQLEDVFQAMHRI